MRLRTPIALLAGCLALGCTDAPSGRPRTPLPFDPTGDASETGVEQPSPDVGDVDLDPPPIPSADLPPEDPDHDPDHDPDPPKHACYPGATGDWSTCLPLIELDADQVPDEYVYPEPTEAMWNYRPPIAYLDLEGLDPDLLLAPNFRLGEIARAWKGRYAVVQPHAIERLQTLRDLIGPLKVHSGYRPPIYNAMIGGAAYSRHMYGDGFDLDPVDATVPELEDLCLALDGHLFEYDTHVHCDWRDEPLDPRFFGFGE